VVLNYSGDEATAQKTAEEVRKAGSGKVAAIKANVSSAADVTKLFDEAIKDFGQVDFLINNAGVALHKPFLETTDEDFDRVFNINTKGTFFCCREAAKRFKDGSKIINLSTSLVGMNLPAFSVYSASKAAVEQMSRTLSKELGSRGITVNVVSPGPTDTELFREGLTEGQIKHISGMASLGRLGHPDDIANMVCLLLTPDAGWLDGQIVRLNGGFS